jgi:glycosyltransferase involved in cell wall biosynthesis
MHRADGLSRALRARGHAVSIEDARPAAVKVWHSTACVISLSPSWAAHVVGYAMHHRGVPWIADLDGLQFDDQPGARRTERIWSRLARRLVLTADVLTSGTEEVRRAAFDRLHASSVLVAASSEASDALDRQVRALVARRAPSTQLRILMIGPVNSPHMEDLALAMAQRGHLIAAGGAVWGGGLPPSSLPDSGIPVSPMTWPQPLWMWRLVRSFRPHVVHANWMPFAAVAALAMARPLVAMAWGSDVYLASGLQMRANRLALRRADSVLADSSALLDRLADLGARRDRLMLLNWGVDTAQFKPALEPGKSALKHSLGLGGGPVVISPRGFKELYNPDVVLAAFAQVLADVPDAQFVLKHNGDQVPDLGPLAESARVHVVGHVAYEEMAQYFRAADVCVSIPATDSSPRSVWEAMSAGCACVLSDLPWVGELIENGRDALVVPADSDSVATATTRLLTDSVLRRSITDHAGALVKEHRDAVKEMDRLEQLYFRLAGFSDRGPGDSTASSSTVASSAASRRRE